MRGQIGEQLDRLPAVDQPLGPDDLNRSDHIDFDIVSGKLRHSDLRIVCRGRSIGRRYFGPLGRLLVEQRLHVGLFGGRVDGDCDQLIDLARVSVRESEWASAKAGRLDQCPTLIEDDAPIGLGNVANNHNRQASAHFGQREQVFHAVPFFYWRGTEDYRRRPPSQPAGESLAARVDG